jgi:hypothetical protein
MKRSAVLMALLCVVLSVPAHAYFVDASELAASAREFERAAASAQNIDWVEVRNLTAYINGAYDTLELADRICKPAGELTAGQLHAVVAKYLKENPEQWHCPAAIVISEGLRAIRGRGALPLSPA